MGFEDYAEISWLIPLLPLIGAIIAGALGVKWLKGQSHWPIWIGVGASAVISLGMLLAVAQIATHKDDAAHAPAATVQKTASAQSIGHNSHWFQWIDVGLPGEKSHFSASAGAWIDPLTVVMLVVVTGIGFFITVFAAGYMKGEDGYFRFFAYLGLFIFSMTCLVMGNNFIMLYLGWEGVGLCSYLLIGYYYDKTSAREAAKKAFIVNRIGDFGFGIGIMLIFLAFKSVTFFTYTHAGVTYEGVFDIVATKIQDGTLTPFQQTALLWIPFCLMLGAFGKSAQFPLYVWLPDAMEGPTPVSALIHAATMVTAGIYMIARCGVLFAYNEAAMITVAFVGAFTALFAGSIALRQFDLKKVFAYSTVSQLGFMFAAVGVLAPVAGVFHLITHAFFKALLFLSSGVVMHAMLGELDMRKFSGLKRVLPKTRWLMLVGCAALAGFPFLAGFYSKDEIIGAAWHHNKVLGGVLLFTALMTAYYTFRLYFRVFEGPLITPPTPPANGGHGGHDDHGGHGGSHAHHDHEPSLMILPLVVLAAGSIIAGFLLSRPSVDGHSSVLGHFLGQSKSLVQTHAVSLKRYEKPGVSEAHAVNPVQLGQHETRPSEVVDAAHATHVTFMIVSGLIALAGIALAYYLHLKNRKLGDELPQRVPGLSGAIENKYWVDEVYQGVIVEPLRTLGRLFYAIDRIVVDGVVWAVGFAPQLSGFVLKLTTQRGYMQGYAAGMVLGIVIILLFVFL